MAVVIHLFGEFEISILSFDEGLSVLNILTHYTKINLLTVLLNIV